MRLETLPTKRLTQMSYEELLEDIRRSRENKVVPNPTKKTAAKKRAVKRKESVADIIKKMSPDERKKFIALMKGEK